MPGSLELSCPSGGRVYVCEGNTTEFIGCCTSNPCADGSGHCPDADLRTTSFSADNYNAIGGQQCADSSPSTKWYTCQADKPPFMGCCADNVDPCDEGSCPQSKLSAARLSSDASARDPFLAASSPSSSPSHTPAAASGISLSAGAIAGIVVGAVVGALLIAGACLYIFRRGWRAGRKSGHSSFEPFAGSMSTSGTAVASQGYQDAFHSPLASPPFHHPNSTFSTEYTSGAKSPYRVSGSTSAGTFAQHPQQGYEATIYQQHHHHISQISEADSEPVRALFHSPELGHGNPQQTTSELSGSEVIQAPAPTSPHTSPGHPLMDNSYRQSPPEAYYHPQTYSPRAGGRTGLGLHRDRDELHL